MLVLCILPPTYGSQNLQDLDIFTLHSQSSLRLLHMHGILNVSNPIISKSFRKSENSIISLILFLFDSQCWFYQTQAQKSACVLTMTVMIKKSELKSPVWKIINVFCIEQYIDLSFLESYKLKPSNYNSTSGNQAHTPIHRPKYLTLHSPRCWFSMLMWIFGRLLNMLNMCMISLAS